MEPSLSNGYCCPHWLVYLHSRSPLMTFADSQRLFRSKLRCIHRFSLSVSDRVACFNAIQWGGDLAGTSSWQFYNFSFQDSTSRPFLSSELRASLIDLGGKIVLSRLPLFPPHYFFYLLLTSNSFQADPLRFQRRIRKHTSSLYPLSDHWFPSSRGFYFLEISSAIGSQR